MLPDGFQQLDPRIVHVRQISGLITSGVIAAAALASLAPVAMVVQPSWSTMGLGVVAWLVVTVLLAGGLWVWPGKAYAYASYRLDVDGLEIRRGVVWRRVINVPRSRVQHTDVSQGPIERSHGLSTLVVHTAGTDHAQVALPGLSRENAFALRDQLLPRDDRDAV